MKTDVPGRRIPPKMLVEPHVYQTLRQEIVSVTLAPGQALSEAATAERFGVSRTPVRAAFVRLTEEGFLDVVPQVGSFVSRIDLQAVHDAAFLREAVECAVVREAARRAGPDDASRLRELIDEQAQAVAADDPARFFEADEAMHARLAAVAGHAGVWQVMHAAKSQMDRIRQLSLADPVRSRLRLAEHRQIIDQVIAGHGEAAARVMKRHIRSIFVTIRQIDQQPSPFSAGPHTAARPQSRKSNRDTR